MNQWATIDIMIQLDELELRIIVLCCCYVGQIILNELLFALAQFVLLFIYSSDDIVFSTFRKPYENRHLLE